MKGLRNPAFDTLVSEARSESIAVGRAYYSVAPQNLYAGPGLTEKIGSLEVATGVKILEIDGEGQMVELELWRKNKGFGRVLYSDFGLNITSAILEKDVSRDPERIVVLESREDDLTGLEWQKVTTQAWIRQGALLASTEAIWNVARTSYQSSCSVCHRQPTESGHDANQWPGLFAGMVGFTNMDDDTASLVLKYLQMHSSDFIRNPQGSGSPENTLQTARP
jgi:trimethylamine-N-oxide reductase cytochrome c-type subunit TorC